MRRLGPHAICACANVCQAIEIKKVTLLDNHWSTFSSKAEALASSTRFWFSGWESRINNLGQILGIEISTKLEEKKNSIDFLWLRDYWFSIFPASRLFSHSSSVELHYRWDTKCILDLLCHSWINFCCFQIHGSNDFIFSSGFANGLLLSSFLPRKPYRQLKTT